MAESGPTTQEPAGTADGAGDGIEADRGGEAAADAVMVAADVEGGDRTDDVEDLIGAGSVADEIAEVPDGVEVALRGLEDGVEGFEVGVNVGEDEGAHSCVGALRPK